ncbi:MAG: hypothetical protein LBM75_03660 [Myxococcales bacterium]|jgi:hypothetical protein|nr:hypothetical protein [Myxococcales bacterium]
MSKKSAKVPEEQSDASSAEASGAQLLRAVERILDTPDQIELQVEESIQEIRQKLPSDVPGIQIRALAEKKLIARYANRAALAGGAASLPAIIPGIGTATAFVGGGLVDMTFCLKYEIEMVLSLASLRGFDIHDPRERQLAYYLAAAHTYESTPGSVPIADFLKIEVDAVWHYTPRQLGKIVAILFVKLAILFSGKGLLRAVPLMGALVSGGVNKALAHKLGNSVVKMLDLRPEKSAAPADSEDAEDVA